MSATPLLDRLLKLGASPAYRNDDEVTTGEAQLQALVAEQVALAVADKTCEWRKQSPHIGGYHSACGKHLCSMQSGTHCQYCGRKLVKIDELQKQKGRDE